MTAIICISGYQLWKMSERYVQESRVKKSLLKYSPANTTAKIETGANFTASYLPDDENSIPAEIKENQFIIDLQNEVNTDITGWLSIPGTKIDYPFVTAADNSYYLRRDIYGNYALAGSLFMDYRCLKNFDGFNSIIYGHNMKNGSMFGELSLFADEGFFEKNKFGTIYLKNNTYALEIFAYIVINSDDEIIYNPYVSITDAERREYFEYVKKIARNYREPQTVENAGKDMKIATLSTCLNTIGSNDIRIILLASIIDR